MTYRVILAIVVFSATLSAAIYKGKSVDGVSYGCSIKQGDKIEPCSVIFAGKIATVKLSNRIVDIRLVSEVIEDPKEIEGYLGNEPIILDVALN